MGVLVNESLPHDSLRHLIFVTLCSNRPHLNSIFVGGRCRCSGVVDLGSRPWHSNGSQLLGMLWIITVVRLSSPRIMRVMSILYSCTHELVSSFSKSPCKGIIPTETGPGKLVELLAELLSCTYGSDPSCTKSCTS